MSAGELALAVLTNGAVVGLLSWWVKAGIGRKLKEHEADYQSALRQQEELFKARLSGLQREWEIRFTPFNQRRIEVLSTLYGDLVLLRTSLEGLRERQDSRADPKAGYGTTLRRNNQGRALFEFSEQLNACRTAVLVAAPFLSEKLLKTVNESLGYFRQSHTMLTECHANGSDAGMEVLVREAFVDLSEQEILGLVREAIGAVERPRPC